MINWEEQWAYFAPGFVDGKAHIELKGGHTLKLLPGPGFGDYSHPTTKLMVALMDKFVANQITFDIGCEAEFFRLRLPKWGQKKLLLAISIPKHSLTLKRMAVLMELKSISIYPNPFPKNPLF